MPIVLAFLFLFFPPQLGGTDTHAYKDAGANLALGKGLTSAFNLGNPTPEFKIYAGYPPGFAVVYGAFASLAGVGPEANMLFELLVLGAAVLLGFHLLSLVLTQAAQWEWLLLVLFALIAVPVRYVTLAIDRPDAFGLFLGFCALLPGLATNRAVLASAALAGVAWLVSPLVGLLAIGTIAFAWFMSPKDKRPTFAAATVLGAVGVLLPIIVCLLALQFHDPTYLERFGRYVHSSGEDSESGWRTGIGSLIDLVSGNTEAWWQRFYVHGFTTIHHWLYLGLLLIAGASAALVALSAKPTLGPSRVIIAVAYVSLVMLCAATIVPWNKYNSGVAAAYLLPAIAVCLPRRVWLYRLPRRTLLVGLGIMVTVQLPLAAHHWLSLAGVGASYERMESFLEKKSLVDRTGDKEVWIAASPASYFLFKKHGYNVLPLSHFRSSEPEFREKADYFAFSYIGSGNLYEPSRPEWWASTAEQVELVYEPRMPQPASVLGLRLSKSSHTWEVELWAKHGR